jgi:hypothetical protein
MKKTLAAAMILAAGLAIAQTTFTGRLLIRPEWEHKKTVGASVLTETFNNLYLWAHTTGTGANQMATIATDSATLTNAQAKTVNLLAIDNGFGDSVTFANVRFLAITAGATNKDNIEVGGAAGNAFASWLGDASDKIVLRPNGIAVFVAPDATGYAIGSDGNLLITNTGTNSNSYVLYVGGSE